jgi:hypothetical protein
MALRLSGKIDSGVKVWPRREDIERYDPKLDLN